MLSGSQGMSTTLALFHDTEPSSIQVLYNILDGLSSVSSHVLGYASASLYLVMSYTLNDVSPCPPGCVSGNNISTVSTLWNFSFTF